MSQPSLKGDDSPGILDPPKPLKTSSLPTNQSWKVSGSDSQISVTNSQAEDEIKSLSPIKDSERNLRPVLSDPFPISASEKLLECPKFPRDQEDLDIKGK